MLCISHCALAVLLAAALATSGQPPGMSRVAAGEFSPPFRESGDSAIKRVPVRAFFLDTRAVTTADFLAFVRANPGYARSRVKRLFADGGYLRTWKGDLQPDALSLNSPVTAVSWHAAKQYCTVQGKRLPTTAEWERVAASAAPGTDAAAHQRVILSWYGRSAAEDPPVIGTGTRHAFGITDMHGVIWEWTSDYNAWSGGGVNKRGRTEGADEGLFCGGASTRAAPDTDYATYMRWAFRASLKPDYTVTTLGFRCAMDEKEK
jgi:formylglycine-generating enzyme